MSVYANNGTSNVDWYCKSDLSYTCYNAHLECNMCFPSFYNNDSFCPGISPFQFDDISGNWYYATSDCIIPKDSIPIPSLSCRITTKDTCIVTRTNKYSSRDVVCDPKYTYCVIQATTDFPIVFPTVFECPNETCDSCKIHCDGYDSCSGATIKGYNCTTLEIHIGSEQTNMTIYAPGNYGELIVFTQTTGSAVSFYNNYVLSVPGTKNMAFNLGKCSDCRNNMLDGSHVAEYMNVSCNEIAICSGSKIICPNDANCNIN
eukprot:19789_1